MKEILKPGYGQTLAQAREEKGMSVADVAAKLKLTARQVEALEAEDADNLPGDVFMRGFVRNYARLMELDPDAVITPMDAQAAVSETITAHSEGVTMSTGGLKRWLLVPLVILGMFVILVAVLYQWLRQGEDALVPQAVEESVPAAVTQPQPIPTGEGATALPPIPAIPPDTELPATTPPADTSQTEPAPSNVGKPAVVTPPTEVPATPVSRTDTPPARPAVAVSGAHAHVLRFQADQDAWVQVVDGEGKRFSKLIRAGGADSMSGMAPFRLVVGEAAQVRLTYDGRPIDLTPFIGQKVARLTLE